MPLAAPRATSPGSLAPSCAAAWASAGQHAALFLFGFTPGVRVSPGTLQQLVRSFVLEGEFSDAEQLARALVRSQPLPEGSLDTMDLLINSQIKAGRAKEAKAWLPVLEQRAPHEALTRRLAGQQTASA